MNGHCHFQDIVGHLSILSFCTFTRALSVLHSNQHPVPPPSAVTCHRRYGGRCFRICCVYIATTRNAAVLHPFSPLPSPPSPPVDLPHCRCLRSSVCFDRWRPNWCNDVIHDDDNDGNDAAGQRHSTVSESCRPDAVANACCGASFPAYCHVTGVLRQTRASAMSGKDVCRRSSRGKLEIECNLPLSGSRIVTH